MARHSLMTLGVCLALHAQPAVAHERATANDNPFAAMMGVFRAEPLTPEQLARLPAARAVIDRMMPPGTTAEVLSSMFGGLLERFLKLAIAPSGDALSEELGLAPGALALSDAQAAELAAVLDPAWTERRELEMAAVEEAVDSVMVVMAPLMRQGMAEAYAVNFTSAELSDIAEFFATPSGAIYARKSYALSRDLRIMAAAMDGMPAMRTTFAVIEEGLAAASAGLPARRSYDDLTDDQRQFVAELTGLDQTQIAEGLARADERRRINMGAPQD